MGALRSPTAKGDCRSSELDRPSPSNSRPRPDAPPLHTRAAGLWLIAALAPALASGNPWHLMLVAAAAAVSYGAWSRRAAASGWGAFLRIGLVLIAFTVLLQPLASSAGETVIATLPALPLGPIVLGGPVTLESLVYGATRGLALAAVLLVLATFSAAVDPYRLVRATPRFLHRSAVALSIALTFVPQTLAAQREIREAMALRGHRFRGLRDLVPLFVALVAGGLERSIDLAEAMEARGFGAVGGPAGGARANRPAGGGETAGTAAGGRTVGLAGHGEAAGPGEPGGQTPEPAPAAGDGRERRPGPRTLEAAIAGGLALAVAGAYGRSAWPGAPLAGRLGAAAIVLGVLLVAGALAAVGRSVRATRYRPERWARRDTVVAAASAVALAAFAAAWIWRRGELLFYPYPRLEVPALSTWLAAALALLAVPAAAVWMDAGGVPSAGGPAPPAPDPAAPPARRGPAARGGGAAP